MRKLLGSLFLSLCLILCCAFTAFAAEKSNSEAVYETTLFDHNRIIDINIIVDDDSWNNMVANASAEEYISCNVEVNGVLYENAGIRPKGNSSLSSVSSRGSERFSFRVKFDKYEKSQTCDGLDTLILNNGFKDPGSLHEALAYDMYDYLNADASLYNYAKVSKNGEYFGVYLALECVDDSFLDRNYGVDRGELYKPDAADNKGMQEKPNGESKEGESRKGESPENQATENKTRPAAPESNENEGNGESAGFGDRGAVSDKDSAMALNYVGDDLETYQNIWDAAKTKTDDADHERVVKALKNVNENKDLDASVDIENVLKYMAIQAFIYNSDGLTGNVSHNYYLYEQDGRLNLIPWDLNEAFTVSGDGSSYVNFPIDTPFTVSDLSQRSFFINLLANEDYLAQYHEYLRILSEEYVQGGVLDTVIANIRTSIDSLVETDPTKFSTYEEYQSTAEGLAAVIKLRAESVLEQLNGSIPSTRDGQTEQPELLLDTSGADLSGLTGSSGFDFNGNGESKPGESSREEAAENETAAEIETTGELEPTVNAD